MREAMIGRRGEWLDILRRIDALSGFRKEGRRSVRMERHHQKRVDRQFARFITDERSRLLKRMLTFR